MRIDFNKLEHRSIEHIVINHGCTFNELYTLISYTPEIRRLHFDHMSHNDTNIGILLPMTLSNLTHLSMYMHCVTFDEFEILITKIYSKLKVLSLTTLSEDMTYLDASRWEQLILQYSPQLEKFYLKYNTHFDDDYERPLYLGESNQFISSFWFERQWIFDAQIELNDIIYSIRPYKYIE